MANKIVVTTFIVGICLMLIVVSIFYIKFGGNHEQTEGAPEIRWIKPINMTLYEYNIYPDNMTSKWVVNAPYQEGIDSIETFVYDANFTQHSFKNYKDNLLLNNRIQYGDNITITVTNDLDMPFTNETSFEFILRLRDGFAGYLYVNYDNIPTPAPAPTTDSSKTTYHIGEEMLQTRTAIYYFHGFTHVVYGEDYLILGHEILAFSTMSNIEFPIKDGYSFQIENHRFKVIDHSFDYITLQDLGEV